MAPDILTDRLLVILAALSVGVFGAVLFWLGAHLRITPKPPRAAGLSTDRQRLDAVVRISDYRRIS
jgi:hypothetical protein